MDSVLLIIPAHNEANTILSVINDLKTNGFTNLLVVDDASEDDTAKLATKAGAKVMSLPYNMGAWKATQAGLRYANENNFEYAITFDADGQHLADSLANLITVSINTDADIIIGSCPKRGTLARHIAWKLFRAISGVGVQDLTSGLRLYNKAAISVLSSKEATLLEYQDVGVLLMLRRFKLEKSEVEVAMKEREHGISRIFYSWGAVLYYMAYTTMLCISKFKTNRQEITN
ncbi:MULTISPECIES: glycosyltransferase family 2 protein [unclassified Pseudoalteromonas]|uniref:glycosyltransferase family 2 protein n=1 Tax=unclassified Pseudoalteromonas TaxID=194690 RepID=UPI0005A6AB83|nr:MULTISPECIES: glycosyltransferase family 2 protein [unclassified Pseudoalteromonas]